MWRHAGLWWRIGWRELRCVTTDPSSDFVFNLLLSSCVCSCILRISTSQIQTITDIMTSDLWPLPAVQTAGGTCLRRPVSWAVRMQKPANSPGKWASTWRAAGTFVERPSSVLAGWSPLLTVCKTTDGQGDCFLLHSLSHERWNPTRVCIYWQYTHRPQWGHIVKHHCASLPCQYCQHYISQGSR